MKLLDVECRTLAPGIVYFPRAIESLMCGEIIETVETEGGWVPARTGIYEEGELKEIDIYGEKAGVDAVEWKGGDGAVSRILNDLISVQATEGWRVKLTNFSKITVSRYLPGPGLAEHSDTGPFNTNRLLTSVTYLNDGYTGGEIVFPKQSIVLKPEKGDTVLFFSEYLHSVNPIIEGKRYALIYFGENDNITKFALSKYKKA